MMVSASELSLECKPHSHSMLLKTIGEQQQQQGTNGNDQTQKLEEFLSRLEEEKLKIDAFKRELPLCMQLLTNGIIFIFTILVLMLINVKIYSCTLNLYFMYVFWTFFCPYYFKKMFP